MKLTRADMLTALQATGFNTDTASVVQQKNWLDTGYMWVWNARNRSGSPIRWSFERVDQTSLAVVTGTATPTMPADYGTCLWIVDNYGDPLQELDPETFDDTFAGDAIAGLTGAPWAFKIVNRQITLGPTPNVTATFKHSYVRRVSHYNNADAITGGTFTADTDYPLWPDHHMIVVFAAAAIGHALKSNPAAVTMEGLRDDALMAMRVDLEAESTPGQVWGAPHGTQAGFRRSL